MKRVFALAVPLLLLLTLSVQAVEARTPQADLKLSFGGTTATCSASCKSDNVKDEVAATLTLYQGNTYVASWDDSGTGRVSILESYEVESGKSYRLVLTYTINGAAQPAKAVTGTCP